MNGTLIDEIQSQEKVIACFPHLVIAADTCMHHQ